MKHSHQRAGVLQGLFGIHKKELAQPLKANQLMRMAIMESRVPKEDTGLKSLIEFIKKEVPLPEAAIEWLGLLGLLYGVPFNNLVADQTMLSNTVFNDDLSALEWLDKMGELYHIDKKQLHPYAAKLDESTKEMLTTNALRFFYVDPNWINSLIDGALSIGVHNSVDFKLQLAIHKAFRQDIDQVMVNHRVKLHGKPITPNVFPEKLGTISGLLFRSPIVAQWVGLEIVAYKKENSDPEDPKEMLEVFRMERLSPSIMLVLFKGVPKKVLIKEPTEGVSSGFAYEDTYKLTMRQLTGENDIGKPYTDKNGNSIFYTLQRNKDFRDADKGVLNIRELKKNILKEIKSLGATTKQISPKDMAIELINSPKYFNYTLSGNIPAKRKSRAKVKTSKKRKKK